MEDTVEDRRDGALRAVAAERRRLTDLAYRLLGSLADAEDVVQEAYARWYALPPQRRAEVVAPGGWLTTVAGRICLDLLGSARVRRERYVGAWLPEPLPGDGAAGDPAELVTLDESVRMAFLVVLESMTPAERVAFVLHDVFRYPFPEVAAVVGRSAAACRQLAASGRRRVRAAGPPVEPAGERALLVREFKRAWEAKDVRSLVRLLDPDATVVADGGGLVQARPEPLSGGGSIALAVAAFARAQPRIELRECAVNGEAGLVARLDGAVVAVFAFRTAGGRITHVWGVRNPEKLRPWA
ncbi:RNA polymerase sigma factor SigJ [Kitasatospora cineracea]|uniref:RNA polymerase sigma-70 factor (ECF subfamily) n=1 Tax=Kitasatospora cineracea TaxID=88074 RepID=A0A8G1UG35_9ACTN|nr:RNA polymerase sigma factor SigJ [Kitasatospora cineracea]ROR37641.1 RNA polymerase sigma-70 factor (ECF subfamily) [Kitasatospora cineracea]